MKTVLIALGLRLIAILVGFAGVLLLSDPPWSPPQVVWSEPG